MKTTITLILLALSFSGMGQTKIIVAKSVDTAWFEFQRKVSDTMHYWQKDISQNGIYTTILLPTRDTTLCYFEYISGMQTVPGRALDVTWMLGYVTRYKEQVTGFMYDKKHPAPVTVLNYKLLK